MEKEGRKWAIKGVKLEKAKNRQAMSPPVSDASLTVGKL
jgi:hypothetical protein